MLFEGKRILITGGTGSLGQVLTRRILGGERGAPRKVVVLSRDEAKQHAMRLSYLHQEATTDEVIYQNFMRALEFRIGDVRDYGDVCSAVRDADIVVNAAALKQVPTCEYFPEQAVLTNCIGPMNIVRAIREHAYPVETVVGVSTDKACKPVSVMGMTKAVQERVFVSANILSPGTRFVCVRYGNVLASRGSVIPLFHEQIRRGGPVTVTRPEMSRFLLSLDLAVDTVLEALEQFLPMADQAIAKEAQRHFKKQGLDIKLGAKVLRAEVKGGAADVVYSDAQGEHTLQVDKLVVAVGRRPFTEGLLAEGTGVQLDRRGFIEVDEHCRTNAPNVWAVGDAVRGPMLAHKGKE